MRNHRSSSRWITPLLALMVGACGTLAEFQPLPTAPPQSIRIAPRPQIQSEPTASFPVLPEDSVEVHDTSEPVPDSSVSVAAFTVPDSMVSYTDEQVIALYRPQAARLGATWITLDLTSGQRRVRAYHVPASVRIRYAARVSRPRPAETSAPTSGSGSVHVGGYYRRDGTYVRPHTRSRPGSGSRPSSRSRGGSGSRRRG